MCQRTLERCSGLLLDTRKQELGRTNRFAAFHFLFADDPLGMRVGHFRG
jgi:hypothetical protein